MTIESSAEGRARVPQRVVPLSGVLFAGLTMAGYLTIGEFPDGSTPAADLPGYYAAHGDQVTLGGTLLSWASICFAIFGVAVWARLRATPVPAVVAGVVLLGAAVDTVFGLLSAATYQTLGDIGQDPHVVPAALQAWHISGAEFGVGGGTTLFLLGVAVAGLGYRAVPRWLAWTGLLLGLAQFAPSPYGFYASLVFLLWVAAAGIALTVSPEQRSTPPRAVPQPVR
jgi:hypothetical protein